MRKIYIIIICLSLIILQVYGQTDNSNDKKKIFIIKTNILLPALGIISPPNTIGLSFEYSILNRNSINLTGYHAWYNGDNSKYNTTQLMPEYRLYFNKKNILKGFFTGTYLKYTTYRDKHYNNTINKELNLDYIEHFLGLGGLFGYRISKKRLLIEILFGLGAGKNINTNIYKNDVWFQENNDLKIDGRLAVNIGLII